VALVWHQLADLAGDVAWVNLFALKAFCSFLIFCDFSVVVVGCGV
jgi:hypothetical protein